MSTFYTEIERIQKEHMGERLRYLEKYYGLYLDVYTPERDTYSEVYGKDANSTLKYEDCFIGILVSDDIFTTGPASAGSFDEGFLYTSSEMALVGKIIAVQTESKKSRRYRVEEKEALGMTDDVFVRYKLSSLAD